MLRQTQTNLTVQERVKHKRTIKELAATGGLSIHKRLYSLHKEGFILMLQKRAWLVFGSCFLIFFF